VPPITRDRMFFQGSPVSGSKQCLGRQNAGGRAPGDSFGADEFRHGLAIVIVHRLLPHHDFAISAVFAGQSSTSRTAKRFTGLLRLWPNPPFVTGVVLIPSGSRHGFWQITVKISACSFER
jgi:hypothetical protein